jgi:hypothetical protein
MDHQTKTTTNNTDKKILFINWPYHPNGIRRQDIRRIYNDTLQPLLSYDLMQLAVSRPKNLGTSSQNQSLHYQITWI